MQRKDFEEDDPFALIGQGFPCPQGYDAMGEMARCFIEELAMMGYPARFVLSIFRRPFYQGPHGVYRAKGEKYILDLIHRVYGQSAGEVVGDAQGL
jgi:hypothetical protein